MSTRFTAAGRSLVYEVVGDGEPMLFVNNIAVSTADMRAFAPLLGGALILVDGLADEDTTVEAVAELLGALLDHLDVSVWLWGYSQGACVAQELALARPDRVRGAVLTATRGRLPAFLKHYLLASSALRDAPAHVATCFAMLASMPPSLLGDDDQVGFALRRASRAHSHTDAVQVTRSLDVSMAYDNRLAALAGVRVPCLVVSFEHDMVCPPQLGREVVDAIPQCDYAEIPGAGHSGLITHTTEVLGVVTNFVERCGAPDMSRR